MQSCVGVPKEATVTERTTEKESKGYTRNERGCGHPTPGHPLSLTTPQCHRRRGLKSLSSTHTT